MTRHRHHAISTIVDGMLITPARRQTACRPLSHMSDDLRDTVARRAAESGWSDPIWLAAPADNPGQAMTADVVSASTRSTLI